MSNQDPFYGFTKDKLLELVGLEYVLTWRYSDNLSRDEKRHRELSDELWTLREKYPKVNFFKLVNT